MGKTKEHTVQLRQMCVDLHKSGNGYKKIATRLHLPISTVRGIVKKFKTTGTVVNKPGRGRKFILPPCSEEDGKRNKKISKAHCHRIARNGSILGSQSLQNNHQALSTCQQAVWEACTEKNLFSLKIINATGEDRWCCGAVSLPKALGTLLGCMASWTRWNTRTF